MKRRVEVDIGGHDWTLYTPRYAEDWSLPRATPEVQEASRALIRNLTAKVYVEWEEPDVD